MNLNAPIMTYILLILLAAILVVQVMILNVLRSFRQPQEDHQQKEHMDNLTFKDLR